jgi:hypothetical protein
VSDFGWISTEDALPADNGEVLAWDGCDYGIACHYRPWVVYGRPEPCEWRFNGDAGRDITHWRELPEPPARTHPNA